MHELGLTQDMIDVISEKADGHRVHRIVLEIGRLSAVLPDAIRFCFDICADGTAAEGAQLDIIEIPGRARCRRCDGEVTLERPFGRCVCGCTDLDWLSGDELRIKEMEVC